MAKNRFKTPILIFVMTDEAASKLAATIPGSRTLNSMTGPLKFRMAMVDHANGEYETLIATPEWLTGWRAAIGTDIRFSVDFDESLIPLAQGLVPFGAK